MDLQHIPKRFISWADWSSSLYSSSLRVKILIYLEVGSKILVDQHKLLSLLELLAFRPIAHCH